MDETFGGALERLRGVLREQVEGYRSLLESTRSSTMALRAQDMETFDRVLGDQVETLRRLKELEREREGVLREVGDVTSGEEFGSLRRDLRHLAEQVSRESRVSRFVIERNGALVEARLALHRRAGTVQREAPNGVNRIA